MKKQILFLSLVLFAFFAGMNYTFGQYTPLTGGMDTPAIADGNPTTYINYLSAEPASATVTPLACYDETGPLNPQVGKAYTYSVDVDADGANKIHWFVTDNTNIIQALNDLTGTGVDPADGSKFIMTAGSEYNDADNTSESINISWNTFDATAPVLLVTYVVDAAGCTDNIKVYRIKPVFKFTLDIAGINETDLSTTLAPTECVSPVHSATWDEVNQQLVVDYGENWLFFSVTAAYFSHSWQPSFQVSYDGTVSDPITVEWAYADEAISGGTWHTTTGTATGSGTETYTSTDAVLHSGTTGGATGTDDGTGESIVVRVRIDHGTNENPVNNIRTVNLGVNGIMYNGTDYSSGVLADLGPDEDLDGICDQVDFDDNIDYLLTPRPLVSSATTNPDVAGNPAVDFEDVNTTP